MKKKTKIIVLFGGCLAVGAFIIFHVLGRPMRYDIPGGYKGWLLIQFENPACPPLHSEGSFRVVAVPLSGRVCTSDHHPDHWTYYKFDYVYSDGTRKHLHWNDHGKPGLQVWLLGYRLDDKSEELFVGDEQAMNHSGTPPAAQ